MVRPGFEPGHPNWQSSVFLLDHRSTRCSWTLTSKPYKVNDYMTGRTVTDKGKQRILFFGMKINKTWTSTEHVLQNKSRKNVWIEMSTLYSKLTKRIFWKKVDTSMFKVYSQIYVSGLLDSATRMKTKRMSIYIIIKLVWAVTILKWSLLNAQLTGCSIQVLVV